MGDMHDRISEDLHILTDKLEEVVNAKYHYTVAEVAANEQIAEFKDSITELRRSGVDDPQRIVSTIDAYMYTLLTMAFSVGYEIGKSGHVLKKCYCDPSKN